MDAALPLDQMTVEEKLKAMEAILAIAFEARRSSAGA